MTAQNPRRHRRTGRRRSARTGHRPNECSRHESPLGTRRADPGLVTSPWCEYDYSQSVDVGYSTWRPHGNQAHDPTPRSLRAPLPHVGARTRRNRLHRPGEPGVTFHALRKTNLRLPGGPAQAPRPLLALDHQGERQDRQPAPERPRGRTLHRLDQQRSTSQDTPCRDAKGRGTSHSTTPRRRNRIGSPGFNRKLRWRALSLMFKP